MEKADAKVDYSKIIPLLPSFRMYDAAVKYITNIRTLMKQFNVEEKDLHFILAEKFKFLPQWHETIFPEIYNTDLTPDTFSKTISKYFPVKAKDILFLTQQWCSITQKGSVSEYSQRYNQLIQELQINSANFTDLVINKYMVGLRSHIRNSVFTTHQTKKFTKLIDVQQAAIDWEQFGNNQHVEPYPQQYSDLSRSQRKKLRQVSNINSNTQNYQSNFHSQNSYPFKNFQHPSTTSSQSWISNSSSSQQNTPTRVQQTTPTRVQPPRSSRNPNPNYNGKQKSNVNLHQLHISQQNPDISNEDIHTQHQQDPAINEHIDISHQEYSSKTNRYRPRYSNPKKNQTDNDISLYKVKIDDSTISPISDVIPETTSKSEISSRLDPFTRSTNLFQFWH